MANYVDEMEEFLKTDSENISKIPYKRILAVDDIHGCFKKLVSLWKKISVTPEDFVIFLGDYVDRGRENVEVLKFIMKESQKKNVIALCGNHEDMLNWQAMSKQMLTAL